MGMSTLAGQESPVSLYGCWKYPATTERRKRLWLAPGSSSQEGGCPEEPQELLRHNTPRAPWRLAPPCFCESLLAFFYTSYMVVLNDFIAFIVTLWDLKWGFGAAIWGLVRWEIWGREGTSMEVQCHGGHPLNQPFSPEELICYLEISCNCGRSLDVTWMLATLSSSRFILMRYKTQSLLENWHCKKSFWNFLLFKRKTRPFTWMPNLQAPLEFRHQVMRHNPKMAATWGESNNRMPGSAVIQ